MEAVLNTLFGVIIGGAITIIISLFNENRQNKVLKKRALKILYVEFVSVKGTTNGILNFGQANGYNNAIDPLELNPFKQALNTFNLLKQDLWIINIDNYGKLNRFHSKLNQFLSGQEKIFAHQNKVIPPILTVSDIYDDLVGIQKLLNDVEKILKAK